MEKVYNRKVSALVKDLKKEREKVRELTQQLDMDDEKLWALVKENKAVKDRIIVEYLNSLSTGGAVTLIGSSGYSALTPVHRPKNLEDAKRLADKIIKY